MLDIKEKRHITVVGRGGASNVDWDDIQNKPEFATVATSGDYDDLTDKPELFSGDYNDLTNKPDLSHYVEDTDLATVATSGSYNDLSDKPTIPAAQVNSDWNASSGVQQILNKPTLATVATSGSYSDLSNTPSLATVATSGSYNDLSNTPSLATVATSGDYNDLTNKPDLSHYVEDTDLATVATSGSYNDLSNTPTIPTVPPMAIQELTFTLQGGTTKTIEFYTVPNYFYVEDASGSDNTLNIRKSNNSAPTVEVFKSTDKINWTSMGTTSIVSITATIPANGKLYLKATADTWGNNTSGNVITAKNYYNAGGNVMSLLYGDNFENKTEFPINSIGNFTKLLSTSFTTGNNTTLKNANKLILPATTLNNYCYYAMFQNCSALTSIPELPSTTLARGCYQGMFWGCTSLTTTPVLPATTMVQDCYSSMFRNCTGLTTAPVLPATTMAQSCYSSMFNGCTRLTTAPVLLATTLVNSCYYGMFYGCTTLTTAPELPATTLAQSCYGQMFYNCSNINNVTIYATDISDYNCLTNWLQNVSASGDFFNLGSPAPTYPEGISGIPSGWTEHTSL